jgi:crotonobetainyl-CoA:carnitine CoA-transferase CaiB-like acyl-CoA transferase
MPYSTAQTAATRMWRALGGDDLSLAALSFTGDGALPSRFPVTDFAAAAWAAAALAVAELAEDQPGAAPLAVDRRLASLWFQWSLLPIGWKSAGAWDVVSGDYAARDGWVRLHANAPHHRAAALRVLGVSPEKDAVAGAVARLAAAEVEAAVVAAGGCAAQMRTMAEWAVHPQGQAIAAEPLVHYAASHVAAPPSAWAPRPARPLAGVRVLDLTRVLAGPIATRFLAGYGAEVLRIDPLEWDEGPVIPEVTLGKRCARLDLATAGGRDTFLGLLGQADVLVHGYRATALEHLGLGDEVRRAVAPGLVDVRLNAYGWTGEWRDRRGFDSLVQMSCGIAAAGQDWQGADRPVPLPVQALDHGTGYLMAAAAVRGLALRRQAGRGSTWRLSLARTAHELVSLPRQDDDSAAIAAAADADYAPDIEDTPWGQVRRLLPPVKIEDVPLRWSSGARALGSDPAAWAS